jgi:iron complex transport system substrate-binding protein
VEAVVTSARLPLRFSITFACAALLAALATGPARSVTLEDATGRRVNVQDTSRIVSIGGAITEILYALGLEKKIVAIDTTSLYPPEAAGEKKSVGYMRQLSPEGVLGLTPTLIVTIEGAGPKETMAILQSSGIPLVVAPDHFTGEGIVEKIDLVAKATGTAARGQCVIERVRTDLSALGAIKGAIAKPKRVLFVLSFVSGRAMVAGRNTAADGIIRLAGATNAIAEYEGYKPINDEAVIVARPDVVLVMERSSGQNLTSEAVFTHPACGATPAAAGKAFVSMDGLYLLGFGPRSARAARDLATSIYPEIKSKPLPSEDKAAAADTCRAL